MATNRFSPYPYAYGSKALLTYVFCVSMVLIQQQAERLNCLSRILGFVVNSCTVYPVGSFNKYMFLL